MDNIGHIPPSLIQELAQEHSLFRTLLDHLPEYIFVKDTQSRFVMASAAVARLLGADSPDALLGKTDFDFYPPELAKRFYADEQAIFQSGQPLIDHEEANIDRTTGQPMWVLTSKVPLHDSDGKVVGIMGISRDITALKQAQDALQQAHAELEKQVEERTAELQHERNLLRTLVDNLPDTIFIKDTQGRFVMGNEAVVHLTGAASQQEVIGKTDFDFFPPELAEQYFADEQQVVQTGQKLVNKQEQAIDHTTGKWVWLLTTKVPILDENGRVVQLMGIGRNITDLRQMMEELRYNDERLRMIMSIAHIGIWEWDIATDQTTWNGDMFRIYGITPQEFTGKGEDYINFTHPEVRQTQRDNIALAFQKAPTIEALFSGDYPLDPHEFRIVRPDGSICHVRGDAVAILNPDGTPQRMLGFLIDITEQVQAAEQLRQSEARYRAIVESQTEMVSRWLPDGTRTYVNDAYCRAFGRTRESLIGSNLIAEALPEEQQPVRDKIARMTPDHPVQSSIHRFVHPDGRVVWHEWNDQGIFDTEGRLIEIQGVGRDVTDRILAEQALAESQRFAESIIQATPGTIYLYDLQEGRAIYSNCHVADFLGYTPEEIQGMGENITATLSHPEDIPEVIKAVQFLETAKDDEVYIFEYRLRHKDGAYRWFMVHTSVFKRDEQGRPKLSVGIVQDIHDQKIAETQWLEFQINQARLQFLEGLIGDLSHDVKTPITAIQASLYLIRKQSDPSKWVMYLDRIEEQTIRLEQLVDNILILIRLGQAAPLLSTDLHLEAVVQHIVEQEQVNAEEKGVHLTLNIPQIIPVIRGDENELWRVFNQLLENAIRYTPSGGQITVTVQAVEDGVQAIIQDTGIGIDPADLPHIFEPFYRADKTRNPQFGGSGLGLAIVKKVIELHGGRIEVDSRLGEGTTFRVWLPATSPTAAAQ